ncbi:hypothetical protein AB0H76_00410 [Nocardia sp. NPDC050712]|uniref:hypothetical protein n=1 Tax=Nocardia sp. NPDC050712 TaxID=3155518 RepID=UPI0033C7FDF8
MTNPQNPDESPEPLTGSAPQSGQDSDPTPSLSKSAAGEPDSAEQWSSRAAEASPYESGSPSPTPGAPTYTGGGYSQTPESASTGAGYPPYPAGPWEQGESAAGQPGQPYPGQPYQQGQSYQPGQPYQQGQSYPGQPYPQANPGQPYQQGQPYPGQSYPQGQSYQPGQPFQQGPQTGGYPQSGQQPYPYPGGQYPQGAYGTPTQRSGTQLFSILGFICAPLALFLCPLLFGPAGIILGLVGRNKGESLGKWAAIAAGVGLVLGLLFSYFVWLGYYDDSNAY